jgi:hypothetical protein
MRILTLLTVSALSLATAAPVMAQDAMMKDNMASTAHMTMSQKHMMKKCNAMSHDMMMKNAGCMKMMKMHPEMMSGDGMMSGH